VSPRHQAQARHRDVPSGAAPSAGAERVAGQGRPRVLQARSETEAGDIASTVASSSMAWAAKSKAPHVLLLAGGKMDSASQVYRLVSYCQGAFLPSASIL